MHEKEEAGKRPPNNVDNLLFDRYPGDNTVNNKKKPEKVAKLRQGRSRKSGSNLFYLCSFIEV